VSLLRKRIIVSGSLLGLYLLCFGAVHAQTGRIFEGKVQDQTGGVVFGAYVTLFSEERVLTTKTDENGRFKFSGLPSGPGYIEASFPGFFSSTILITDKTPEQVSFTLAVGWGQSISMECPPNFALPPSVAYEERAGSLQLTGTVTNLLGVPSPLTHLALFRADINATVTTLRNLRPFAGMTERSFDQRLVAEVVTNEKGEFQLSDLEPGWYSLESARDGYAIVGPWYNIYELRGVRFWIASKNLTRLSRTYLVLKNYAGCYDAVPRISTQDSPLPLSVKPPLN